MNARVVHIDPDDWAEVSPGSGVYGYTKELGHWQLWGWHVYVASKAGASGTCYASVLVDGNEILAGAIDPADAMARIHERLPGGISGQLQLKALTDQRPGRLTITLYGKETDHDDRPRDMGPVGPGHFWF